MFKKEKVRDLIIEAAARFLQEESNQISMITVTGANVSDDLKKSTIFFTVFPENKEEAALNFTKRKRGDFREYFKSHAQLRTVPFFDFEIDQGEKNRQKIDELGKNF